MEIEELKKTLRSLAVSSPVKMTVAMLQRDYRSMVGEPLPVHKFGYRDVTLFLKERCADSFVFTGSGPSTVLVPIVPDTIKHIDRMVQKQRIDPKMRHKGKRWSIEERQIAPAPNLIAKTFQVKKPPETDTASKDTSRTQANESRKINPSREIYRHPNHDDHKSPRSHNTPLHIPEENNSGNPDTRSNNTNSPDLNYHTAAPITKSEYKQSLEKHSTLEKYKSVARLNENESIEENHDESIDPWKNLLRKRLPVYDSTQDLDQTSYQDNDSGKCTLESDRHSGSTGTGTGSGSGRQSQLEELKWELTQLVLDTADGVCCTDLMKLYRERYNKKLNFSRFGYTSIAALALTLPSVQAFREAGGNTRLLSASAPKPAARPVSRASRPSLGASRTHLNAPTKADDEDALPGIPYDREVFPQDCLQFSESIPPMCLDDIEVGGMVELMVGEVYSPSHFWFYRLGDEYNIAMENIMDEMTEYYGAGGGRERVLAMGAVRTGHYCSSVYANDWHRSLIVKVEDSETVKVRHVDYGTVDRVPRSSLKPLLRQWGSLPAQGIRGRLAGVKPVANGRRWTHNDSAAFLKLVQDRKLVGSVVSVDREENIVELYLIDTSTECDVFIDMELINAGHADSRAEPHAHALAENYLYPRFGAIEEGDTPNYAGIVQLLSHGFVLDCVEDYRRHVPRALPPPSPVPSPSPPPPPPAPPTKLDNRIPFLPLRTQSETSSDESEKELSEDELEPLKPEVKVIKSETVDSNAGRKPEPEKLSFKPPVSISRVPAAQIVPECRGQPRLASVAPHRHPRHTPPPAPLFAPPPFPAPSMPALPFFVYPQPMQHCSTMTLHGPYPPPPLGSFPSMEMFGPPPRSYPSMDMFVPPPRYPPNSTQAFNNIPRPQPPFIQPVRPRPPQASVPPATVTSSRETYISSPNTDGSRVIRTGAGEVTLTVSECQVFNLLNQVDKDAAHWYIVDAISRAMNRYGNPTSARPAPRVSPSTADSAVNTPSTGLNPFAREFRLDSNLHTRSESTQTLRSQIRPPPGFESVNIQTPAQRSE